LNEADLRAEVETTSSDAAMAELAVLEGEEKRVVGRAKSLLETRHAPNSHLRTWRDARA